MREKTIQVKRKKRKLTEARFEDDTEYLEFIDALMTEQAIKLDKDRKQEYII